MAETSDRDARRWVAYERLAADASASASERAQARERLVDLRARYPEGRPRPPGELRYRRGRRWGWEEEEPPAPVDPVVSAARAAAERAAGEDAVRGQRASVLRVPGWERSETLRELLASPTPWSSDDHLRFKEQRVRLTGSSRAVDG